jgi:hypothetical protein
MWVSRSGGAFLLALALRRCRIARLVGRTNGGAPHRVRIACDAVGAIDTAGQSWTIVRRRAVTPESTTVVGQVNW